MTKVGHLGATSFVFDLETRQGTSIGGKDEFLRLDGLPKKSVVSCSVVGLILEYKIPSNILTGLGHYLAFSLKHLITEDNKGVCGAGNTINGSNKLTGKYQV